MQRATIFEVAKRAGVSIKTVSRVINHEPNVREATERKVREAIDQLGFRPVQAARNLAGNRSNLITLIYDDPSVYDLPSAGYIIEMQQGALSVCHDAFCELLIHPCVYQADDVTKQISAMIDEAKPAGVVIAAPLSNVARIVRSVEDTGTPCVLLSPGDGERARRRLPSVSTNDREVSAEMTRYLASLGHQRIGFISGDDSHRAVADRHLGYQDGLKESGLRYSTRLVVEGDNSFGAGEEGGKRLLLHKHPPTAIFAANDDMAAGVMRAAVKLGLSIPDQLSVAGFDDISLARQLYPSLTTIRQPLAQMAARATELLIGSKRQEADCQVAEVIPATVQIRESTGPAPTSS